MALGLEVFWQSMSDMRSVKGARKVIPINLTPQVLGQERARSLYHLYHGIKDTYK